jgi:cell division protein FtsI/penicillin-binding protein 2
LSVNPEKISSTKEQAMLELFSEYAYIAGVNFQNTYLENVLPNSYVPVLTFTKVLTRDERDKLLSYPGVTLAPYISRIFVDTNPKSIVNTFYFECCTAIYSSYNYHGVIGVEKDYDNVLWGYSGGKILMKDDKGGIIKVVFEKDKKDGKDVVLK